MGKRLMFTLVYDPEHKCFDFVGNVTASVGRQLLDFYIVEYEVAKARAEDEAARKSEAPKETAGVEAP